MIWAVRSQVEFATVISLARRLISIINLQVCKNYSMEYPSTNSSDDSSLHSKLMIGLFISSPSIVMICMAVLESYFFPLIVEQSHLFFNDTKSDMIFSILWTVFISLKLRSLFSKYWFFSWWPILAVFFIVAVYLSGAFMGLPIGREEMFPAVVVMLPTIGFLLIISGGSLLYYAIKWLTTTLRG